MGQLRSLGSSYPWKVPVYIPSSCNVIVRLSPNNHWHTPSQTMHMASCESLTSSPSSLSLPSRPQRMSYRMQIYCGDKWTSVKTPCSDKWSFATGPQSTSTPLPYSTSTWSSTWCVHAPMENGSCSHTRPKSGDNGMMTLHTAKASTLPK